MSRNFHSVPLVYQRPMKMFQRTNFYDQEKFWNGERRGVSPLTMAWFYLSYRPTIGPTHQNFFFWGGQRVHKSRSWWALKILLFFKNAATGEKCCNVILFWRKKKKDLRQKFSNEILLFSNSFRSTVKMCSKASKELVAIKVKYLENYVWKNFNLIDFIIFQIKNSFIKRTQKTTKKVESRQPSSHFTRTGGPNWSNVIKLGFETSFMKHYLRALRKNHD